MESMRRSEENISRHPNKVAPNTSIVTGSNIKHSKLVGNTGTTGPVSSNVNKKLNTKSQLQQTPSSNIVQNSSCRNIATNSRLTTASKNSSQTDKNLSLNIGVSSLKPKAHILETTKAASSISFSSISSITNECKDTNFEYEDEWDIGGIPELLDDLDADIEKSSSVTQLSSALSNSGGGNNTLVNKTQSSTILISSINAETDPLSASSGKTSTLKKQSEKPLRTPTEQISKHRCTSLNKSGSNIAINSTLLGSREGNHKTVTSSSTSSNIVGSKNLSLKNFKQKESILVARLSADQNSFKLTGIDPALSSSNSLGGGPNSNKLSSSNFTGFAKGGNLVSLHGNTSTDSILSNRSVVGSSQTLPKFQTSSVMSSQSSGGSSSNNSSSVGGTGSNQGSSQNSSNSTSSSKSNAKMSIDHQATLDKGLKMKIKRTKPGTKTSEAKHEIVKATEQQQNGTLGSSNSLDDSGGPSSSSHSSTSSSINNSSSSNSNTSNSGGSNTNVSNAGSSNKKHLGSSSNNGNNNGNQCSSHSGGNSNSSGPGNGNNAANNSQTTPQSTKRGSSGHRRDKAKEKAIHSNRLTSEKSSTGNEKESSGPTDKSSGCQCIGDSSANGNGSCSNHACPRRSDNSNNTTNMLTQRMNTSAVGPNTPSSAIPPGVFTPSIGSPAPVSSGATGSLIVATSSATSTPSVQSTAGTSGPNAPGPPGKDASTCGNIKISSHIAAQLAAAAASNTFTGSISGGNNDGKPGSNVSSNAAKQIAPGMISATVHHTISVPANHSNVSVGTGAPNSSLTCPLGSSGIAVVDDGIKSPPAKRSKHNDHVSPSKDMVDICIGTSVGTITEPDCLGPCEPGTSVTLEGIVWHETEGGVLVVNVTWRGKTYVGTLLDCTRHDWAPPRFCDSPTEELDARTPKGRGKRGRSAALTPDLSNFTETRSSIYFSHAQVHSKLRNGATKGRGTSRTTVGGTNSTTTTNMSSGSSSGNGGGATPSTSPTAFLPPRSEKRKSKDESPSPINGDTDCTGNIANASGIPIANTSGNLSSQPQSLVNPMTGLNVQISTKKCKTASPCAISPVLLECPEQDCSKKYKHANGLRYHQSAAHGSIGSMDEDSLQLPDEPPTTPSPGPATQAIAISIPAAGETESVPDNATPLGSPIAPIVNAGSNSTPSISAASPSGSSLPPPQLSQQTSLINVTNADTVPTAASMTVGPVASSIISVPDTATATNSMSGVLLSATQPTQLPPPLLTSSQQHSVAGGSITAGVSGQALSQQALGISTTTNMSQHLTEQQQNILQQGSLKSGVLRFGQPNDTPATATSSSILNLQQQTVAQGASGGPQTNTLPGQNTLRTPTQLAPTSEAQQQSSVSSYSSGAITTAPSLQQGISLSTKPSAGGFPVVAKQKKCRKSPGPIEYDGMMSRDDVQSPAYSDISDDSTPVGDQEILDKSQPQKHLELLNKKPIDLGTSSIGGGAQAIPALGGYGMYQFYQQQQYMVPPDQTQSQTPTKGLLPPNLGQQTLTLPSQTQQQGPPPQHHIQQQSPHLTDYTNKTKDPPLDLITKSSNQHQSIGQQHPIQDNVGNQKENPASQPPPPPVNLSNVAPPGLGGLTNLAPAAGPSGLPTPSPAKPMSHFYPFNYMASGYPYNVEPNYGPVSIVSAEDSVKLSAHGGISSSQSQSATQHQGSVAIKEERTKESPSPHDGSKLTTQQMVAAKVIKTEPLTKQEIKQEPNTNAPSQPQQHSTPQQPHAIHPKDLQGLGGYPNIYQRHPMSLAAQQHLSREEELRRYYILSEEQRRAAIRAVQAQNSSGGGPPGSLQSQISVQHKDDSNSVSQHPQHSMAQQQQQNMQQQQQKSKSQSSVSNLNAGNNKAANLSKETPKSKQDEEIKVKQEGQKPTMETQGPPPPPTSQYFLHPSYIAPAPFSFDPNHPMYRNVLMSAAGPYNAPPYHLPMPRYHAPEDLSRNAGTKALDALHHAASQYYTTHKIHELSERALKSPTSSGSGPGGPVKVSVSSPNVGVQQQPTNAGNVVVSGSAPGSGNSGPNSGSHIPTNQSGSGTGLTLNLQPPPNTMSGPSSKTDLMPQKTLGGSGNSSGMIGPPMNIDPLKQQGANGSSGTVSASGNVAGNTGSSGSCAGTATDSRSPPPQRHVHTHHHTHVGLGYPMYTAPYGAAVLASQQAAAVAVINPFPPGPTK